MRLDRRLATGPRPCNSPPPDTAAPRQRCIIDAEACMHGSGLELALVFLLAAVIAVPVVKKLGTGAVLAYLGAGVWLGPDGFGLVRDPARIPDPAESGVAMPPSARKSVGAGRGGCVQVENG